MKLRIKFFAVILTLMVFLGTSVFIIIRNTFQSVLSGEFHQRQETLVRSIAIRSADFILIDNLAGLLKFIKETKEIEPQVEYIFLTDRNGKVIVHTFGNSFPKDILKATNHLQDGNFNIMDINTTKGKISDIVFPIPEIKGTVRLGLTNKHLDEDVFNSEVMISTAILIIFFFGLIILNALFNRILIVPIQKLTKVVKDISTGNLNTKIEPKILEAKDEIGELARAFDRTIVSLKLSMREQAAKDEPSSKNTTTDK